MALAANERCMRTDTNVNTGSDTKTDASTSPHSDAAPRFGRVSVATPTNNVTNRSGHVLVH